MDTLDAIKSRRSIRKFKDQEVSKEILDKILDAGRWAPSGMNTQPWVFIIVEDSDKKKALRQIYDKIREGWGVYKQDSSFLEKTTIVLACMETEKLTPTISVSLAVENMMVAAKALGIDSLIMTTHMVSDETKAEVLNLFNPPENIKPHSLLAFGYGDEKPPPKERKPDKETFFLNKFGESYILE